MHLLSPRKGHYACWLNTSAQELLFREGNMNHTINYLQSGKHIFIEYNCPVKPWPTENYCVWNKLIQFMLDLHFRQWPSATLWWKLAVKYQMNTFHSIIHATHNFEDPGKANRVNNNAVGQKKCWKMFQHVYNESGKFKYICQIHLLTKCQYIDISWIEHVCILLKEPNVVCGALSGNDKETLRPVVSNFKLQSVTENHP